MKIAWLLTGALLMGLTAPALAQENGVIAVIGRGMVEAAPDHVTVSLGVSTKQPTATAALDANSAAARRVIAFAKSAGVEERDLQTEAVRLSPAFRNRRTPQGDVQEPDGYLADNTVRVTLRSIGKLGDFMRSALDNGANVVAGVDFGVTNMDELADKARARAVADAMRQAALIADAAKVKLGPVLRIDSPPRQEGRAVPMAASYKAGRGRADRSSVPIEAGTIEVSAEVDMTWRLVAN